jgi:NAD(P)-dependent dehydrogenase (short-subunit alcohol dehydrogenase family)
VNYITPATFESPILRQMPQSQIDYMRSRIPIGRLGEASESAALVCWQASEQGSFSTAATFDISGGGQRIECDGRVAAPSCGLSERSFIWSIGEFIF